jgi:hypothetical protein
LKEPSFAAGQTLKPYPAVKATVSTLVFKLVPPYPSNAKLLVAKIDMPPGTVLTTFSSNKPNWMYYIKISSGLSIVVTTYILKNSIAKRNTKMYRTHPKTSSYCDWLQIPWICVVGEKGSRCALARLRAFSPPALTTNFSLNLITKQISG